MQDDNVKVTSVVVQHPPVTPALGYRFDFPDRSIAFSGDTARSEAVAQMAKGADILVHEALDFPAIEVYLRHGIAADPEGPTFEASMAHMLADHTSAEDVGRIAQEAGVKTLVLYTSRRLLSAMPRGTLLRQSFSRERLLLGMT
jgi:ribonuclease BN (tRNA processing enzyme)